jgi:plasmid stability protein
MPKMVQIRHVPDDVHRRLKARAAVAGMSLSDYLLAEVRRALERPTLEVGTPCPRTMGSTSRSRSCWRPRS